MKTAEDRASALLNRLNIRGKLYDNIKPEVIFALKEQDRDTRHACAEAVTSLDGFEDDHGKMVMVDEARFACMNAIAV